jgi:serine phosphatase RsbU (regulator of sigma subunit)
VYKKTGNNELSLEYGKEALEIGKKIGYPDIIRRAAFLLYGTYKQENKTGEALEMHELYIQMRDSTLSDQTRKAGLKKQYQYEFDLKEKELKSEQEKREILYSNEIKRQKIIFNASLIGGIIFLVFSIVLYKRFMLTRKQKGIIEVQKVEMDKAFSALHEKNKEVMDSIYYARRIQNALLTSEDYVNKHFKKEHFILYKPKDIVSGDFYWGTSVTSAELGARTVPKTSPPEIVEGGGSKAVEGSPELFYLAVCDSTGHGVPGAFMSLLNIGFLSEAINEKFYREPNIVFNYARKRLIDNVNKEGQKDGFDGALFCFDVSGDSSLKFTYAAAYCKPVIIRKGEIIYLDGDRMPVGMGERTQDFRLYEFTAEKNDMLYIFTDGYADQFGGADGKKFKYKRLVHLLSGVSDKPMNEQQQALSKVFDDWKGNLEQVDDVCVIGVRL